MKVVKRFLIVVAIVVILAVVAVPVAAAAGTLTLKAYGPFSMSFPLGGCTIVTEERATQHYLFGKLLVSTNIGKAQATGPCPGGVPTGLWVPFAVVDIANWPWNSVIVRTYGIATGLPEVTFPAGVNAQLTSFSPLAYTGYAYMHTGPQPSDYLIVPFQIRMTAAGLTGSTTELSPEMLKQFAPK